MTVSTLAAPTSAHFELRFQPLCEGVPPFAFPCDAAGHVDMDALTDATREKYLYARTVVGRVFQRPAVAVSALR